MAPSRRHVTARRALFGLYWVFVPGCVIPLSTEGPGPGDAATPAQVGADGAAVGADGSAVGADGSAASTDGSAVSTDGGGALPPPAGSWTNVTANLAGLASECGNMTGVFSKPGEDLLIAGIAQDGLWASSDGGASWQALGTGPGSAVITNRPTSILFDPDNAMRYWESGLYNGGGVYETMDDGLTFVQLGDVTHSDLVSVDLSDPNRQTLLAGSHETPQVLHRSTDGGMTWTDIGSALPTGANCTYPLVIDSQTFLVGCSGYGGGPSGVYLSADGGMTWTLATASGGASAPLRATSDSSIYWVSPLGNGMTRSTDNGQHWTDVVGPGFLATPAPVELPDGRLAAIGPEYGTQYVEVSADHGATWNPETAALPYSDAVGVVYSAARKAFYVWHFTCGNGLDPVPPDAIMSFGFDYQTQ